MPLSCVVAAQRGKHRHELFMSLDTSKLPLGRSKSYLFRYPSPCSSGYLSLQFRLPPPLQFRLPPPAVQATSPPAVQATSPCSSGYLSLQFRLPPPLQFRLPPPAVQATPPPAVQATFSCKPLNCILLLPMVSF
jgi:hypothetical protein